MDKKVISKEQFKIYIKNAKSGDPAKVVQDSEMANDEKFAMMIAERDMTQNAPRLAVWLVNNKNADPKWAYDLLIKSKYAKKIDSLTKEALLDRINNPSVRQSKRDRIWN